MSIYWIYDMPNWLLGISITAVSVFLSVGGLLLLHGSIQRKLALSNDTNNAVCGYIGAIGVILGLLLGFVAVATWQEFNDASSLVSREASEVHALYLDVGSYPAPYGKNMQEILRTYVTAIIDREWPAQMGGKISNDGLQVLHRLQQTLFSFEPQSINQQVIQAETFQAFNKVLSARRMRVDAVNNGLPAVLWYVVLIGSALSVFTTYFFHFPNFRVHLILTSTLAAFTGLVIFLIVAVDNPFRGAVSISADSYRLMLEAWTENLN